MEDGQPPPDADKGADSSNGGGRTPRAGLRLRDAEAVATTRRDMFGDGSLLDALAPQDGAEPAFDAEADPDPQPDAPSNHQLVPQDDGPRPHAGADALSPVEPPSPEEPHVEPETAPEASAESLDAIIDSFPDEAPADAAPAPEPHADPSFLATSAFSFREPRLAKEPGEADQPPAAVFERYQVSAIFQGLGPEDGRPGPGLEGAPAAGEAPAHEAAEGDQPLPPAAVEATAEPLPPAQEPAQGGAADGGSEPASPDAPAGPHGLASALDLNMWPPLPSAPADVPAGGAGDELVHDQATDAAPRATMPHGVSMPDLAGWPPFPEAPGAQAADAPAAGAQVDAGLPHLGNEQFLGTPAWPPFPELPGGEADVPPTMPAGLPPYIELPATPEAGTSDAADAGGQPGFADPREAEADARYVDHMDGGQYPRPDADEPYPGAQGDYEQAQGAPSPIGRYPGDDRSGFAYPDAPDSGMDPAPHPAFTPGAFNAAARASNEATAKIAAEANATAQALDNLQRLLNHSIPPPETPPPATARQGGRATPVAGSRRAPVSAATGYHDEPLGLQVDPPGARGGLERYLPLPLPSSGTDHGKRVYLLGFATGLVLSVVAGIALYILIALGN